MIHHHWIHWHDSLLIWILGAYACALRFHDACDDQQHALRSGDDGERVHPHDVPSCDAHGVCAHEDARVQQDERVYDVRDDVS